MNYIRKRKKSKLTNSNSNLSFKNKNFKFFSYIHNIIIKTNLIAPKKICIIKRNKDTNKEYQNSLTFGDSYITLKVSGVNSHKIFGDRTGFTKPDKIIIDDVEQSTVQIINLTTSSIIKLKWTNRIEGCLNMFYGCNTITEINFTDFNATKCITTCNMLRECYSLISVDLSGFITSNKLTNMANMFWDCKSLISVDFSNFDTSEVITFGHMFFNCESLTFINFPNVITDKAKKLDFMFGGCRNLISVNLSNFYTTHLEKVQNMFEGCESLKSIDFPNLYITNLEKDVLKEVFKNCSKLEYINIQNFDSNSDSLNVFFQDIPDNLIICIDKFELIEEIQKSHRCILISCKGNSPNFQYKFNEQNQCFAENCSSTYYN